MGLFDVVTDVYDYVEDKAEDAYDYLEDKAEDAYDVAKDVFNEALEPLNDLLDGLDGLMNSGIEGLHVSLQTPGNLVSDAFENLEEGVNWVSGLGADVVHTIASPVVEAVAPDVTANIFNDTVDAGFAIGGGGVNSGVIVASGVASGAVNIGMAPVEAVGEQVINQLNVGSGEIQNLQTTMGGLTNSGGTTVTIGATGQTFPLPPIQNQINDNKRQADVAAGNASKKIKQVAQSFINS